MRLLLNVFIWQMLLSNAFKVHFLSVLLSLGIKPMTLALFKIQGGSLQCAQSHDKNNPGYTEWVADRTSAPDRTPA